MAPPFFRDTGLLIPCNENTVGIYVPPLLLRAVLVSAHGRFKREKGITRAEITAAELQHWASLIEDAERPALMSSRDGKLLKPVPKQDRLSRDVMLENLYRLPVDFKPKLISAWSRGAEQCCGSWQHPRGRTEKINPTDAKMRSRRERAWASSPGGSALAGLPQGWGLQAIPEGAEHAMLLTGAQSHDGKREKPESARGAGGTTRGQRRSWME